VIRAAVETQPVRVHCVHLNNPTLSREEFIEMLTAKFGLSREAATSKTRMLVELEALLTARRTAGETTVLIVDEAQSLPLELLEEIRLLSNIETDDEKLLSVIIAGQPELADRLNEQALRQFKQRVSLRCMLGSLSRAETETYIRGRIQAAGGSGADVFTAEAMALVHEGARGLPRTINVIADNALLGGFAAGRRPVDGAIVREVCGDFDIPLSVPSASPARPAAATPAPAAAPGTARLLPVEAPTPVLDASATTSEGKMFDTFTPKRRRFSFFWN
jgi:general secretion pathway protein A